MKAMIFAAGLGTRLKPLTDTMPKALVPVCGKPLLWHVMTKLKASGINDVTINVHHFADKIISYLESVDGLGMDVHISDERDMLLETGGGIRHAERYLCRPAGHVAWAGSDEAGHAGGRNGDSGHREPYPRPYPFSCGIRNRRHDIHFHHLVHISCRQRFHWSPDQKERSQRKRSEYGVLFQSIHIGVPVCRPLCRRSDDCAFFRTAGVGERRQGIGLIADNHGIEHCPEGHTHAQA